jgi:hypothetical protein
MITASSQSRFTPSQPRLTRPALENVCQLLKRFVPRPLLGRNDSLADDDGIRPGRSPRLPHGLLGLPPPLLAVELVGLDFGSLDGGPLRVLQPLLHVAAVARDLAPVLGERLLGARVKGRAPRRVRRRRDVDGGEDGEGGEEERQAQAQAAAGGHGVGCGGYRWFGMVAVLEGMAWWFVRVVGLEPVAWG